MMMYRAGGLAACFAILLAAGIVFFVGGDSDDDVATEAVASTTTTESTTTTAVLAYVDELPEPDERPELPVWKEGLRSELKNIRAPTEAASPGPTTTTTPTATTVATTAPPATAAPSGPAPVNIPRPACAAGLGGLVSQTGPFTGASESIPSGLPAVVVKVSNNSSASRRALIGLDRADVVFEERIEASATRFAAVFHSELPANVGPVRSGRTTDIAILRGLGQPVLGYSGANPGVTRQFAAARDNGWFTPVVNTDRAPFARDGRYTSPDNLFVDPASLGACGNGGTPSAIFSYGAATSTSAQAASSVSLQARSPYRFGWDAGSGTWLRSQDGTAHVTREGRRLAPENVVVLFVPYIQSQIDASSVDAQTTGSGSAWILRDGTITIGSWSRANASAGYRLTDASGTVTRLHIGQTWVVLAPAGSASWG
jgi:hypothetical protein